MSGYVCGVTLIYSRHVHYICHRIDQPHPSHPGKDFIFLAMPQAFFPQQMLRCQQRLASVLRKTKPRYLVKLSSFGIDAHSSKFVMVGTDYRFELAHGCSAIPSR
jgi:hypothetical protein